MISWLADAFSAEKMQFMMQDGWLSVTLKVGQGYCSLVIKNPIQDMGEIHQPVWF